MNPLPLNSPTLAQRFSATEYAALHRADTSPIESSRYICSPHLPPSEGSTTDPASPQTPEEKSQPQWDLDSQMGARHQMEMTAAKLKALALAGQRRVSSLEQENKYLKAALAGGIFRGFAESYQKRFPQDQHDSPAPGQDFTAMSLSVTVMINCPHSDTNYSTQDCPGTKNVYTASQYVTSMSEVQKCLNPSDLQILGAGLDGQPPLVARYGYCANSPQGV